MRRSDDFRQWWFGPFRISDEFLTRRPVFGTDEYFQHVVSFVWPFSNHCALDGDRLYWGISIWLPSTCRKLLRSEVDALRGWDEEQGFPSARRLRVLDGGMTREHDPRP